MITTQPSIHVLNDPHEYLPRLPECIHWSHLADKKPEKELEYVYAPSRTKPGQWEQIVIGWHWKS